MNETGFDTEDMVRKAFGVTGFGWIKKHNGKTVEGKATGGVHGKGIWVETRKRESVLIDYADVEDAGCRDFPERIDDSPARVSMIL